MRERDDLNRASEHLDRASTHAGDAAHHTKEAMKAGASGTLDRATDVARETGRKAAHLAGDAVEATRETARDVGHKAGHVAARVRDAEPNVELEHRVDRTVEGALDKTGATLQGVAPTVGRGVESTVRAAGSALHIMGGVLGFVVGKIAGRVGGWWSTASEAIAELPKEEVEACRVHFEAYEVRPAALDWETAQTAYALGYLAAENPEYRERGFDEIEPDVRHGFGEDAGQEYEALRDFTRFGYERAMIIRPSQDEDRVSIH